MTEPAERLPYLETYACEVAAAFYAARHSGQRPKNSSE
jgi:hypothetical protein